MAQVKKRDILLSYPYESMDPFLKLDQRGIHGSGCDDH